MRLSKFFSSLALGGVLLSGCANWIPSEDRMRMNSQKSTYDLCHQLTVGTLAPKDIRAEWAMELRRRGASCSTYAVERANRDTQERAAWNRGLTSLSRSMAAQAGEGEPTSSNLGVRGNGITCFKQGETLRSTSRHCVYNCAGTEVIQTVSAAEVCPLSLTR